MSGPKVHAGGERDREDIGGTPIDKVEVEVILQLRRIQDLEGNLVDFALTCEVVGSTENGLLVVEQVVIGLY